MLTPRSLICWSLSHNPALDNSTPHVSRDKVYTLIRISTRWPLEGYWIEEWSGHDSLLINKSTESINVRKLFKHQATVLIQHPKAVARGRCTRCTCSSMHFKIPCGLKRPQTFVHLQWQFVATALYPYKFSKIFENYYCDHYIWVIFWNYHFNHYLMTYTRLDYELLVAMPWA